MTFTHDQRPAPLAQDTFAPPYRLNVFAALLCCLAAGLYGASAQADALIAFEAMTAPSARAQAVSLEPARPVPAATSRARAPAVLRDSGLVEFVSAAPARPQAAPAQSAHVQFVPAAPATAQRVSLQPSRPEFAPVPRDRVNAVSLEPEKRPSTPVLRITKVEVAVEPAPPVTAYTPQARPLPSRDQTLVFSKLNGDTAPTVVTPTPTPTQVQVQTPTPTLTFTPTPTFTSTPRADQRPAARPVSVGASTSAPRRGDVPGVSALATLGVSSAVAAGQVSAIGPSERELREMFHRAVQAAAERSPKVQSAMAEQYAADADIDEAKGQRWPQVDIGTTAGSKKFGKGSEDSDGGTAGVNLSVVTPVYDWGRIRNTIDSRQHLSEAATAAIQAELENSAFDVTTKIVELGKQRLIVELSQQYVDRMNELVKMLAGIVAVDKGRSSELTQAKSRMLQAQAARDSADSRAKDAEINLRKLVGDRPLLIPNTPQWNIRLVNLDTLLSKIDDHPTLHQAKAQTESAELQAKVVRASSLPQLNWVINKSTAEDSLGREQPWETHLAVSWGAFRGGSTRASERAALQRAEAGRQQGEQQRLDLEYGIRIANHEARTFLERAELYRNLTTESDGIRVAFYEQWYHLGKRTLLDVLSAESDHYGNRVSEITNRFDGYQAILRQYAGAGTLGNWLKGDGR